MVLSTNDAEILSSHETHTIRILPNDKPFGQVEFASSIYKVEEMEKKKIFKIAVNRTLVMQ